MSTTIILKGEPISTNSVYKSHSKFGHPVIYMTTKGKSLKESYQWQAKSQWKKGVKKGEVELGIFLYFGTKRKCDWDNFHKLSMDALTNIVWADDSQIQRVVVEKGYDKENPRIELEVLFT